MVHGFGHTQKQMKRSYLKGADDGLVTIDAAKLDNMTDFITLNAGHAMLRYKASVAEQVVLFLNTGAFRQETEEQS